MLNISNNGTITITKGDTFDLELLINCGTILEPKRYKLNQSDKIYFALEEPNQEYEQAIIKKELSINNLNSLDNIVIHFTDAETANLISGTYYYEVKLHLHTDKGIEINTIVPKTKFIVL